MVIKEKFVYKCGSCKKPCNRLHANKLNNKFECDDCCPYLAKESVWFSYVERCRILGFNIKK